MPLSEQRWSRVSGSEFPWERSALEYLRVNLPDLDTYRAWANFSFIADDGTVNEVDALVLTPQGVFLIEIKSHPGTLTGDRGTTWVFDSPGGRSTSMDNPLILAERKSKKLKSLLLRTKGPRNLYIEALVFVSNPDVSIQIQDADRIRLCQRDRDRTPGIIAALKSRRALGLDPNPRHITDRPFIRAFDQALNLAGIRQSRRMHQVGDYEFQDLLGEGPDGAWQDFSAKHTSIKTDLRRVRIYNYTVEPPVDQRIIKSAATREYEILRSLKHPGILEVTGYTDHELGPALLFQHEPGETRLDFYLRQHGASLTLDRRLDLVRQIADALRYAHGRRIVHRALGPESILVTTIDGRPRVRIFNWQAGRELPGTTTSDTRRGSLTVDPREFLEPTSAVYLPPEAITDPHSRTEAMDVFSLGAVAFLIFTNQPPAANLHELYTLLAQHRGLPLPAVLDAASESLQLLIREATHPDIALRVGSAAEFLEVLNKVEEEWTVPATEAFVANPLEARSGDRLPGNLTVSARLGSGSTATAFLVVKDAREYVLKLALKPEHTERLRSELETLGQLDHAFIVKAHSDLLDIGGHAGFLMERAGETTLAGWLRSHGRLSLDLLGRFGHDLLDALHHLEDLGIPHRDIKPDNIGVHQYGKNREYRLKLFDFSLSRLPLDYVQAGTPQYREPYLLGRKRWDSHADRFSATLVLYEMATGVLPQWTDVTSGAASIEPNLIDAPVRESLARFFERALRRDAAARYVSAEEMGFAWYNAFAESSATESRIPDPTERQRALSTITLDTPIIVLGLSTRAENVLAREGIHTVSALLAVSPMHFRHLRGVGNTTRKEIVELIVELRGIFPQTADSVSTPRPALTDAAAGDIDDIAAELLPSPARSTVEREITAALLDLFATGNQAPHWPKQADVAGNRSRQQISQILAKTRERWKRTPSLTSVRTLIGDLLQKNAGYLEVTELAQLLLAARGSSAEGAIRLRRASAVLRAAVEAEATLDPPGFFERRCESGVLILHRGAEAVTPWAQSLAIAARTLACAETLPSPARVLETLRAVNVPDGLTPPADARLVYLAATLAGVAVSPRLELYPKNMSAAQSLQLSAAALAGAEQVTPNEIRGRVADRYPEAEPLPDPPVLTELLRAAGLELKWDSDACVYRPPPRPVTDPTSSISYLRTQWRPEWDTVPATEREDFDHACRLERTLANALRPGSWLVLTVSPEHALDAAERLAGRFGLREFDLDRALLAAMRDIATTNGIDWNLVVSADADGHPDRAHLEELVREAMTKVENAICMRTEPLLLTLPGLLGRFHMTELLNNLHEHAGVGSAAALWLLAPGRRLPQPAIDKVVVPTLSDAQRAWLSSFWLSNKHRHPGATINA